MHVALVTGTRPQIIKSAPVIHALEKEAEQRRQKLVEAAKDRKIFELLKEKRQLRHRQDIEKQDQKELDEVAVGSFRRKKTGGDSSTATPKS